MEKISQFFNTGAPTPVHMSSAKFAIDIRHALENYTYDDYKYLTLDYVIFYCDLVTSVVIFLSKNNVTEALL